jgi:hypothetical protein
VQQPSEDQRIRKGLKFLCKADRRAVKAAVQLEKLTGLCDPPGVGEVLQWYRFTVQGKRYEGRMSRKQYEQLKGHVGSKKAFADAIADVILSLNNAVVDALKALSKGLCGTQAAVAAAALTGEDGDGGVFDPPLGCCNYDTNLQKDDVTEYICEVALLGEWKEGPCGNGQSPEHAESQKEMQGKRRRGGR